ncbi:MAG: DoxX family membrane protein [Burkholderiaceae bacterium]
MFDITIAFTVRLLPVALFLPFSAFDKVLEFDAAVDQCTESLRSRGVATAAIVIGLCVEVFMALAILIDFCDRMAAFVLAGYCCVTALLWKPFWKPGDFWVRKASRARGLFWDFRKNFALAGGFPLITFGTDAGSAGRFFEHPFSSKQPYASGRVEAGQHGVVAP